MWVEFRVHRIYCADSMTFQSSSKLPLGGFDTLENRFHVCRCTCHSLWRDMGKRTLKTVANGKHVAREPRYRILRGVESVALGSPSCVFELCQRPQVLFPKVHNLGPQLTEFVALLDVTRYTGIDGRVVIVFGHCGFPASFVTRAICRPPLLCGPPWG